MGRAAAKLREFPHVASDDAEERRPLPFAVLVVEQGLYSASNFALAALAGSVLEASEFGLFALLILVVSIAINAARAVWHEPDLVEADGSLGPRSLRMVLVVGIAVVVGVSTSLLWLLVAACVVAGVVQDRARYSALASRQTTPLLIADAVWLAVVVTGFVLHTVIISTRSILALWLVGASLATLIVLVARVDRPLRAVRVAGRRRIALLGDYVMVAGMNQVGGLLLALLLPLGEVADLRGANIVFGPISIVIGGLTTWIFATVDIANVDYKKIATRAGGLAAAALALTVVLTALPEPIGLFVLGSGWPPRSVLALIGISASMHALSTPPMMLLRMRDDRSALLRVRVLAFVGFMALTITLAIVSDDAVLVAVGYAVANAALAVGAWLALRTS